MRTLFALTCLVVLSGEVSAQEIYKWEDDNGVLHYSDQPAHPTATLFQKDRVPYSQPRHNDFRGGRLTSGATRGLAFMRPEPHNERIIKNTQQEVSHGTS